MVKIAICEDEAVQAEALRRDAASYFLNNGIEASFEVYPDGQALLSAETEWDLLFLDCLLPDGSGVEFARRVKTRLPGADLIFLSAYPEYLFDSYSVSPFRFLLKPVSAEKLGEVLGALLEHRSRSRPVFVMTDLSIPMDSVACVFASGNNISVVTEDTVYASRKPLSAFSKELSPALFIRLNRNCIINIRFVAGHRDNVVQMTDGREFRVSRRMKSAFLRFYIRYLKSREIR